MRLHVAGAGGERVRGFLVGDEINVVHFSVRDGGDTRDFLIDVDVGHGMALRDQESLQPPNARCNSMTGKRKVG